MATDLETVLATDGRDEKVAEVRRRIDAEGITYIYYQFVSVTGRIMGKGVPGAALGVDQPGRASSSSTVRPPTSSSTATASTSGTARRPPSSIGIPEPETFMPLPWDPKVARVFCTLFRGREETNDPASFLTRRLPRQPPPPPGGARGADRHAPARRPRARDDVAQAERRRHPVGRGPVEALLLPHRPVLGVPADHPQGDRVLPEDGPRHDPGRPRGRPGPARAELQLRPRRGHGRQPHDLPPGLQAGRAARCSAFPCFMPKPFMGVSANGCHHNISLWKRRREPVHAREATTSGCRARSACRPSAACSSTSAR